MSELTGDADEEASWAALGVNERDHKTIPPAESKFRMSDSDTYRRLDLCGILSSDLAWYCCGE